MKKLSLMLALLLVLSCFAFAACGGEEESSASGSLPSKSEVVSSEAPSSEAPSSEAPSSEAPSSEAPAESSDEAPVESSDEAPVESSDEIPLESSSEAPSTEEPVESSEEPSSEAPVESSDEEPVESSDDVSEPETPDEPAESTNVALGATYDAKGYKVAAGEWPADYTANLTDGVALNEVSFDNQWFAFCTSAGDDGVNVVDGVGTVILDLGKASSITKVRVNTLFGENVDSSGVNGPTKIVAYVGDSATGEFTELGELTSDMTSGVGYAELTCAGQGQFVKVEVTLNGIFAFINEIEVYN